MKLVYNFVVVVVVVVLLQQMGALGISQSNKIMLDWIMLGWKNRLI